MNAPSLPASISVDDFDALHDNPAAWQGVLREIASAFGAGSVRPMTGGTVLVALLGRDRVLKLYPPFLRDHHDYERAALQVLAGRLSLPTPTLLAGGERDGWPYLLMTQLRGQVLLPLWPRYTEAQRCRLLFSLGELAAEAHAQPIDTLRPCAPAWSDFIAQQRLRCHARQQRTGLPAHLLAQLDDFLQGDLPHGPDVLLTGEYTPMNLLVSRRRLCGMFDFGDGLLGPREYDWLGPLTFLASGHAARCQAFFDGYGVNPDAAQRLALMRLMLLHRYSCLRVQITHPGWQEAPNFEALTALVWP